MERTLIYIKCGCCVSLVKHGKKERKTIEKKIAGAGNGEEQDKS